MHAVQLEKEIGNQVSSLCMTLGTPMEFRWILKQCAIPYERVPPLISGHSMIDLRQGLDSGSII